MHATLEKDNSPPYLASHQGAAMLSGSLKSRLNPRAIHFLLQSLRSK
nr:hypothetical protein [uncultured Kingella sp.]